MSTESTVLWALKIVTPEDIKHLSEVEQDFKSSKKTVGEDLILFEEAQAPVEIESASVEEVEDQLKVPQEEVVLEDELTSLWEHELRNKCKIPPNVILIEKYKKVNEGHLVKFHSSSSEGTEDRFASTNGILINKKQA